jgi:hypothetical protein
MRSLVGLLRTIVTLVIILTSKMQCLSVALVAGMSVAIPYAIEFPSITIDLFPTLSATVANNTMTSVASFSNQTTSVTLTIYPILSSSATSSNNYTNISIGACGPGIGSCPPELCCR